MRDGEDTIDDLFFSDPSGTRSKLLAATYRALCAHGYAGLSLQTIGEEFEKSASLIYYHYDSKDELVLDTLDAMLDRLEEELSGDPEDPAASMQTVLETLGSGESGGLSLEQSIVELRGHAPSDEAYRQRFERADAVLDRRFEQVIRAGNETGVFSHPDPGAAGELVTTVLVGTMVRRNSSEDTEWIEGVRTEIEQLLQAGSST